VEGGKHARVVRADHVGDAGSNLCQQSIHVSFLTVRKAQSKNRSRAANGDGDAPHQPGDAFGQRRRDGKLPRATEIRQHGLGCECADALLGGRLGTGDRASRSAAWASAASSMPAARWL